MYGVIGIVVIVLSEFLFFLGVKFIGIFFTPLVWSGYILVIDALNARSQGTSLISSHPREFLAMLPWSVVCWLVFEGYNLYLRNWQYIGLPENIWLRSLGYIWSFATIFPAMLETAEFFENILPPCQHSPTNISVRTCVIFIAFGVICLAVPLLVRQDIASPLFALVWVGFYFFLDPINFLLNGQSVLGDVRKGLYRRIYALFLSGLICGLLWEFWNYWAIAKWKYSVPLSFAGPKIFEMPLLGYLGFLPFALECYAMQEMLVTMIPSLRQRNLKV